jgi:arabinogalactan endo-1,4-beta-galactosidase
MRLFLAIFLCTNAFLLSECDKDNPPHDNHNDTSSVDTHASFVMGADLSYVNQILDHGGIYRDSAQVEDPYVIFKEYGANVIRFRLFHNPVWTKEVYTPAGNQMYNDFNDVKLGIQRAKENKMQVCLDFHYSDSWADPGKQVIPEAWKSLTLQVLRDSVYNYTYNVLKKLDNAGLMPEFVQPGNEINPGFLLPLGDRWGANTPNFIYLMNAAISAIRKAGNESRINPEIIIHIAQPENVSSWFAGLKQAGLTDYDIIGFSYYYMWSDVPVENISTYVSTFRNDYGKDVMIMETAYPWTTDNYDSYGNIIDVDKLDPVYPASISGQYQYLCKLTQEIIDGGGKGIFYWEPAWISSQMKDLWGTGSAWECNTFFDFGGNVIQGMKYMTFSYDTLKK